MTGRRLATDARAGVTLAGRIKVAAHRLGFDRVGIAPAEPPEHLRAYERWIEAGAHGEMEYMARHGELRADPGKLLPGARSAVMVAMNYRPVEADAAGRRREGATGAAAARGEGAAPIAADGSGVVARYARGRDYHDLMRERLRSLLDAVRREAGPGVRGRVFVDTAPVLERDLAARAGIGWIAKNTCLIDPRLGSYTFLGGLLLDIALEPDLPQPDRCGTCTRCMDACPTGAFIEPRFLDARRCLSYHTIELRGPFPPEHRDAAGDLVFGCDICQEVCPYNRAAPATPEPGFEPDAGERARLDLIEILSLDEDAFRRRFARTALTRARRRGLARNAAVALGNARAAGAAPALARALRDDPEAVVRAHAAWALGKIGGEEARRALQAAAAAEADADVRAEIDAALGAVH